MLIEIILGERAPGAEAPIQYSIINEGFRATINGEAVFEPVAPLRERFAKLKARDNLLGAVLARLREDPSASESTAHNAVNRVLNAQAALEKIAKGLGLSMAIYDMLASDVLAINTELSSALSLSQAEVKALAEENARIRAEVEQERGQKLHAMTAADIAISRAAELEAEVRILKGKLADADLGRIMAEATAAGMKAALQHLERALAGKLRA
jgi:hypothetical protein